MLHLVLSVDPYFRSCIRQVQVQQEHPLERLHQDVHEVRPARRRYDSAERIAVSVVHVADPLVELREPVRNRLLESIRDTKLPVNYDDRASSSAEPYGLN